MSNKVDIVDVKQSGYCICQTKWILYMSNKVGIVYVKQSGYCICQTKWIL